VRPKREVGRTGLLLFGGIKPSPQLRTPAADGDVQLIGLNDLYA
jgi:hypothetical protein